MPKLKTIPGKPRQRGLVARQIVQIEPGHYREYPLSWYDHVRSATYYVKRRDGLPLFVRKEGGKVRVYMTEDYE